MCEIRDNIKKTRYATQMVLTIWKILVFMSCILISLSIQGDDPFTFFSQAKQAFEERYYTVHEVRKFI